MCGVAEANPSLGLASPTACGLRPSPPLLLALRPAAADQAPHHIGRQRPSFIAPAGSSLTAMLMRGGARMRESILFTILSRGSSFLCQPNLPAALSSTLSPRGPWSLTWPPWCRQHCRGTGPGGPSGSAGSAERAEECERRRSSGVTVTSSWCRKDSGWYLGSYGVTGMAPYYLAMLDPGLRV